MPGIVYTSAPDDDSLGRFGDPIAIANNAVIPPGEFFIAGAWRIVDDSTTYTMGAGYCRSDGVSALASAATHAIPLGARGSETWKPEWPWSLPWPLGIHVGGGNGS